jgi:hypothetical protein
MRLPRARGPGACVPPHGNRSSHELTPPRESIVVIKRVSAVSCAKVAGTLYGGIGLIFGAVVSMIALANGVAAKSSGLASLGTLLGAGGAIIAIPIVYGCIGYVGTLLVAALYNIVASIVGGIQMDVE